MEGTHCKLRSRLTNRLCGDDANSFTDIDRSTTTKISTVTFGTQAVARIAGKRGAYFDFVDPQLINQITEIFIDQGAGLDNRLIVLGIDDITDSDSTEDTLAQSLDDFTTFDQGLHGDAIFGSAIIFDDHQILRHVNQTAGQISRVRSFQRSIGQTLTRTVCRNEVLKNVQAFTEVGGNRRFDNRTVRLGHQTSHTGQLTNLGSRTPRSGISHHVDRVERFLLDLLAMAIDDFFMTELLHHDLGHLVTGTAPDINNLVIALTVGNQTVGVLAFDFFNFALGVGNNFALLRRNQHIVRANRNTGTGRQTIAILHQLVGKNNRFLQTTTTESRIDELGDFLFLERPVKDTERQALGQNF